MGKKSRSKSQGQNARRTVKMDQEVKAALDEQLQRFREKFGREPGPKDPIFFDPDSDTPRPYPVDRFWNELTGAARRAGLDPATIYAINKSGVVASESNWEKLRPEDRKAWSDAIDEYHATVPGAGKKPENDSGVHYLDMRLRLQFKPELQPDILAVARHLAKENTRVPVDDDDDDNEEMRSPTDEELEEDYVCVQDSIGELIEYNPLFQQLGIEVIASSVGPEEYAASFDDLPRDID